MTSHREHKSPELEMYKTADNIQWRKHLRAKQVKTANDMSQYADYMGKEMTLFAADRLELLMAYLHDQIAALKEQKAAKGKKSKRKNRRQGPTNSVDVSVSRSPMKRTSEL